MGSKVINVSDDIIGEPSHKSRMLEICQKLGKEFPEVKFERKGPQHMPIWQVSLVYDNVCFNSVSMKKSEAEYTAYLGCLTHFGYERTIKSKPIEILKHDNIAAILQVEPTKSIFAREHLTRDMLPHITKEDLIRIGLPLGHIVALEDELKTS